MSSINSVTSTASSAGDSSSTSSTASSTADSEQNMFLQLLVAQLKNQDPLNPMDGTAFVTQLAQFQQLDESIQVESDVSSILQDVNSLVSSISGSSSTDSSSGAASAVTNS